MFNSLTAFGIGAGCSLVVYCLTRFSLGARADKLFGVMAPIAFFVSPWWAALAGALSAHSLGVVIASILFKKPFPRHYFNLAIFVMAAYFGMCFYTVNNVLRNASSIAQTSYSQSWKDFSLQSPANRFATDNYRPCIDAKSKPFLLSHSKYDPSVCRSSTVTLAAAKFGQQFALEVDSAITNWTQRPVDADANEKIEKLLGSL